MKGGGKMNYAILGKSLERDHSVAVLAKYGFPDAAKVEVPEDALSDFFAANEYDVVVVRSPYQRKAFQFIDTLSERAKAFGKIDTVIRRPDGTLYADFSEPDGILYLLDGGNTIRSKNVYVICRDEADAQYADILKKYGARGVYAVADGTLVKKDAEVIINLTEIGSYPALKEVPLTLSEFPAVQFVADTVSDPLKSALVLDALNSGIKAKGGIGFEVARLASAAEALSGVGYTRRDVQKIEKSVKKALKNIVFIGMPGSGKSVISKLLAQKLGREFCDIDRILEAREGKTIPEIFESEGEAHFRELEIKYTAEICSKYGAVIATGGGVVTRDENRNPVQQNATVIYLIRSINALSKKNRPVSNSRPLEELAAERTPKYKAWSDMKVLNTGIGDTLGNLLRFLSIK